MLELSGQVLELAGNLALGAAMHQQEQRRSWQGSQAPVNPLGNGGIEAGGAQRHQAGAAIGQAGQRIDGRGSQVRIEVRTQLHQSGPQTGQWPGTEPEAEALQGGAADHSRRRLQNHASQQEKIGRLALVAQQRQQNGLQLLLRMLGQAPAKRCGHSGRAEPADPLGQGRIPLRLGQPPAQ